MNLLTHNRLPLLPTKIENATIPSLIKIKFGLRFRLGIRYSWHKHQQRTKWRDFFKRVDVILNLPRQAWEVNTFRKGSQLLWNYSPNRLHFIPMRGPTIEEMCDCACVCMIVRVCVIVHVCVIVRVCARACVLATELPSRVGPGSWAISVYWHIGSVIVAKLTPRVTPRHFVFNVK